MSIVFRASKHRDDRLLRRFAQIQRISDNNMKFASNCIQIMKLELLKIQKEKKIDALKQIENKSKLICQLYEGQLRKSQTVGFQEGRSSRSAKSLGGLIMDEQTKASRSD